MVIGDRLRALREAMNLSRVEIEKRIGLHRGYISRIESWSSKPLVELSTEMRLR